MRIFKVISINSIYMGAPRSSMAIDMGVSLSENIMNTSPSVSVALRRIGATHLKLTAAMRPYSPLFLPCRMLYALLSTISHSVNFVPIIAVES